MNEVILQIRKPDDSGNYWTTKISSDSIPFGRNITLNNDRGAKDPIHKALTDFFTSSLKRTTRNRYRRVNRKKSFTTRSKKCSECYKNS